VNKPTKTKEELRTLILGEIREHPVCPPGMDVLIEPTEGGGWKWASMPPPGSPIAHADCVNYIGQIAKRLHAKYALSSETADELAPRLPRLETSNVPQRNSNTVLKAVRHGMVDSTSSAEKPPVNFPDSEAVAVWLAQQPPDVLMVFTGRAALRAVPAVALKFRGRRSDGELPWRKRILDIFRCVAVAWAKTAYPSYRAEFRAAAAKASSGFTDVRGLPERAAAYAAAVASTTSSVETINFAATACECAIDAVAEAGRQAFEDMLNALANDAQMLAQRVIVPRQGTQIWQGGLAPETIAHQQLWPVRVPDWARDSWELLKSALLEADEHWEVWTKWYEARILGHAANQNIEVTRAKIDSEVWQQGPRAANARIREIIEEREIFDSAFTDEPELGHDVPSIESVPEQVKSGSRFRLDAEGRIDLVPDPPTHGPLADDLQRELYREIRYKALGLAKLGHNQLADLSEPIDRFLAASPDRIEDVSITRLWSRGNTLRRRLKAHDTATPTNEPTDPALFPALVVETLRDLVESYNAFIAGDPLGRELDHVRFGPQEREAAQEALARAVPIVDAVDALERLATAAAKEALTEQINAALDAPHGVDGDQATDLARKTTGNFVIAILRAAYSEVRFAWNEARAGTYRYAGPALIAGGYIPPIISFVVENANKLTVFVQQAFQNPTLVRIIELIATRVH
jgi:hypothetical protein